jgi:hypothetical protein
MKTLKNITSTLLLLMVVSIVSVSQHAPPPDDDCWDISNTNNWGDWNELTLECVANPPVFERFYWRGCDNGDIQ